jgi:hypothetical protein
MMQSNGIPADAIEAELFKILASPARLSRLLRVTCLIQSES